MEKKVIKLYCGEDVDGKVFEHHPVEHFDKAKQIVNDFDNLSQEELIFSTNSPDFLSALNYIARKSVIDVEIYLNGKPSTIEDVFQDWNRFYDLLDEYLDE